MYPKWTVVLRVVLLGLCCARVWAVDNARILMPEASINGHSLHLALDTGSGATLLYDKTAKWLELKVSSPPSVNENSFPKRTAFGLSEPVQLKIGMQLLTAELSVLDLNTGNTGRLFIPLEDGVVGWPEVRNNILVFDAEQRRVKVVDKLPPETANWLKLPIVPAYRDVLGSPLCLQITTSNGEPGILIVDTGFTGGVNLPQADWQTWRLSHPQVSVYEHLGYAAEGGVVSTTQARADQVTLGQIHLTDVLLDESEAMPMDIPHFAGVIGMAALRRMDLVLDGKGGFAYIRPKQTPDTIRDTDNRAVVLTQAGSLNGSSAEPKSYKINNVDPGKLLLKEIKPTGIASSVDTQNWYIAGEILLQSDNLEYNSAVTKILSGNTDGGIANLNQILATTPNRAFVYLLLGDAKTRKKRLCGSHRQFEPGHRT